MRGQPLTHLEGNEGLYGHEDEDAEQHPGAGPVAIDRWLPPPAAGTGTSMVTPADELALVQPMAAADELEAFVTEHYGRLIRLAGLVCHDLHEAEDAVQAALERAWRRRGTLADFERMRPWLDHIVVNEAIRSRSRPRPTGGTLPRPPARRAPTSGPRSAGPSAASRTSNVTVVVLHLYAGYSLIDTAEIVGAPLETVRSRLRLARQHLRLLLAEESAR